MPASITYDTLYSYLGMALLDDATHFIPNHMMPAWQPLAALQLTEIKEIVNGVVHPMTDETIPKYQHLVDKPLLYEVWMKAMCNDLVRLAQGHDEVNGTDMIHFMSLEEITKISKDRTVMYAYIVVDYHKQKADTNHVQIRVVRI